MDKQIIEFAIKKSNNIVTGIGRSYIKHPEIHFSGGSMKWYTDKMKTENIKQTDS